MVTLRALVPINGIRSNGGLAHKETDSKEPTPVEDRFQEKCLDQAGKLDSRTRLGDESNVGRTTANDLTSKPVTTFKTKGR